MNNQKRNVVTQTKHDKMVEKTKNWYASRKYKVVADLPGEQLPKKIGGYIPDIIAKKGKQEKIIEIETQKTLKTDRKQQDAFEKYAKSKDNTDFTIKLA